MGSLPKSSFALIYTIRIYPSFGVTARLVFYWHSSLSSSVRRLLRTNIAVKFEYSFL